MKIKVLATGGTIDDLEYNSLEKAPKNHRSLIPNLLKQARLNLEYDTDVLMQKDSRWITNKDRELIFQKCRETLEDRIIIITHGTMTMPQTAKYLGRKNLEKTIVLLGSAIPANKKSSDALFNLGTAFSAVQLLPPGVYVSMNGMVFSWRNVKKNLTTGRFEEEQPK